MLIIECPYCGKRYHSEFLYGGDGERTRPAHDDPDEARWFDYVFLRDNPAGRHVEYWQHVHGCRAWLRVERDTVTHEILSVTPARPPEKSPPAEPPAVQPAVVEGKSAKAPAGKATAAKAASAKAPSGKAPSGKAPSSKAPSSKTGRPTKGGAK